jgi:hypothetical protein
MPVPSWLTDLDSRLSPHNGSSVPGCASKAEWPVGHGRFDVASILDA